MEGGAGLIAVLVPIAVSVSVLAVEVVLMLASKSRRGEYLADVRRVGLATTLSRILREEVRMDTRVPVTVIFDSNVLIHAANHSSQTGASDATKYVYPAPIIQAPQIQEGNQRLVSR
jgi:hypothetical protein